MTLTIWKFDIPTEDEFTLTMPRGARVLSVQVQHGAPRLWALVDPEEPTEEREFWLRGTGHSVEFEPTETVQHLGTFQIMEGSFVGHVFEVLRPPRVRL